MEGFTTRSTSKGPHKARSEFLGVQLDGELSGGRPDPLAGVTAGRASGSIGTNVGCWRQPASTGSCRDVGCPPPPGTRTSEEMGQRRKTPDGGDQRVAGAHGQGQEQTPGFSSAFGVALSVWLGGCKWYTKERLTDALKAPQKSFQTFSPTCQEAPPTTPEGNKMAPPDGMGLASEDLGS